MERINEVNIETTSCPSQLRITDMGLTGIVEAPMDCTILRIDTNQGISGYGEIRGFSSRFHALGLKRLVLGGNPCGINRIFRKIRQFGGHARQDGDVSGIEVAPWDLAGKAYGTPVCQTLGGGCHDSVRVYCNTDVGGKHAGSDMGHALRPRMDSRYTMLKMDPGVDLLINVEGTLNVPLGYAERIRRFDQEGLSFRITSKRYVDFMSAPHPFTDLSITETGLDYLEDYVKRARDVVGYEIPLAVDHIEHVNYQTYLKLARRLEEFNIFWMEDCIPWFYAEQWKAFSNHICIPMCAGEDISGREAFRPLVDNHAVSVIHPNVLTAGGIGETLHIIVVAEEEGIVAVVHMAETSVGCMATAHVCAAAEDGLLVIGYHAHNVDQWNSMVGEGTQPTVDRGWLKLKDRPGLGIEELNDEVLVSHIDPQRSGLQKNTDEWDREWSHDRTWS